MPVRIDQGYGIARRSRAPRIVGVFVGILCGEQITGRRRGRSACNNDWCAGKLGPWLVWNIRSAKVYSSASWK